VWNSSACFHPIELKAHATRFFSQLDEDAFFAWLKKLPCVSAIEGRGDVLFIQVVEPKVDEYALRDLLALFWRYGIDMKQLSIFDRPKFARWFHNADAYWYKIRVRSLIVSRTDWTAAGICRDSFFFPPLGPQPEWWYKIRTGLIRLITSTFINNL
jgi:hypothetical protein